MRITATGLCMAALLVPQWGSAQDAGIPQTDPAVQMRAAVGPAATVAERSLRYRGTSAQDTTVPIRTVRGRCYEVIGYATGASQVGAQVVAREAEIGRSLALANSTGRAMRQGFCATQGGPMYALRVHAEGPAWWSIAVIPSEQPAPASGSAEPGHAPVQSAVDAGATAPPPVGGTEHDYVGGQVRAFAARHPTLVALLPVVRRALQTNETYEAPLPLASGRCVDAVVAGVPSVADLVVEIFDPSGNRVAQDDTHQSMESAHYCPSYGGSYRLRVRMFSGMGLVAIQPLTEP